jgi:hypothetical protein
MLVHIYHLGRILCASVKLSPALPYTDSKRRCCIGAKKELDADKLREHPPELRSKIKTKFKMKHLAILEKINKKKSEKK